MGNTENKNRIEYVDLLRIIAAFCVIVVHVYAYSQGPNGLTVGSKQWIEGNVWPDAIRWALDVFILISGAVFLRRDFEIKTIYTKYIKRILVAYIIWGALYALIVDRVTSVKAFVRAVVLGHAHMWYCPMIIGLYMITPLLRKWVKDIKLTEYFLLISFIAVSVLPSINGVTGAMGNPKIDYFKELMNGFWANMNLDFLLGYVFFYVLGYYLAEKEFSNIQRKVLYILGIIGVVVESAGTIIWSTAKGESVSAFMGNFSVCSVISAIAVFVFAKYNFKTNKIINKIAGLTFGIYMVHMGTIELLVKYFDITVYRINALIYIPLVAVLILAISTLVSFIISFIPVLKKYMI